MAESLCKSCARDKQFSTGSLWSKCPRLTGKYKEYYFDDITHNVVMCVQYLKSNERSL